MARRKMLPLSKSAPRANCALVIFSLSSISVGIKRRAIVIIMAISWDGTPILVSGRIKYSNPSARAMGEVVRVSIDVQITRKIIRSAIKVPR